MYNSEGVKHKLKEHFGSPLLHNFDTLWVQF